jgi:hypothetical protein
MGVIYTFKSHYRQFLMQSYILNVEDANSSYALARSVSVLDAVNWIGLAYIESILCYVFWSSQQLSVQAAVSLVVTRHCTVTRYQIPGRRYHAESVVRLYREGDQVTRGGGKSEGRCLTQQE